MSDFERRFGGVARLFGATGLGRLRSAHVMIVGIGGVGSWVAEALARSGVGALTLVDLDDVCVSNVNRQLHALNGSIGQPKVEVMADRIRAIHPECRVVAVPEFFTADTSTRILIQFGTSGGTWVVDAIDTVTNKCRLIADCRKGNFQLITCGAAGGKSDPTQIRVADLAQATHDRLLSEVRRRLRGDFDFPRSSHRWGIPAVFSAEPPQLAQRDGTVCAAETVPSEPGESRRLNCDHGFGSVAFLTGSFGFAAAAHVVRSLAIGEPEHLTLGAANSGGPLAPTPR
ncbi:MAG TPA: tRNA threonylcarbamoyladenosine dehydratase [Verrucomicrobiota bacterium]|nr:tRNA threonylcarbamoyladenosine dehydratase [Verrucomicrobiota bacterium]